MKATVIIPTKNPGDIFPPVLAMALDQDCPWPFEVLVIDSGSSDGTVELVRNTEGVRLIEIAPEDFGHGKTRNFAIAQSSAEFCAFLTHDALPTDRHWLANLVSAVEQDDSIAGAFGRHIAYDSASIFTKRDLLQHFKGFLDHPLVVARDLDADKYENDVGWRQFLHFYSDNNSCLRRSVWEQIPYPDVDFAEDQIWAQRVVEAGHKKAYAQDAVVTHSHDYSLFERLQRSFDEANAFRVLFGYRLCSTLPRLFKSAWGLAKRDWVYGRKAGLNVRATAHQALSAAFLVLGHYLGTHAESMPDGIKTFFSRDRRLLKQLAAPTLKETS